MTNHSDLVVELRETLKWATGRDQRTILNAIDVLEGLTEQSTDGSNEPVSEDVDEVRTNIRMQAVRTRASALGWLGAASAKSPLSPLPDLLLP